MYTYVYICIYIYVCIYNKVQFPLSSLFKYSFLRRTGISLNYYISKHSTSTFVKPLPIFSRTPFKKMKPLKIVSRL